MGKAKYVITATRADGKSVSPVDRALGDRLKDLPNHPGVTVTVRNAND